MFLVRKVTVLCLRVSLIFPWTASPFGWEGLLIVDFILFALILYKAHRMHLESGTTRTRISLVSVIVRDGEAFTIFDTNMTHPNISSQGSIYFLWVVSFYSRRNHHQMMMIIGSWLCSIWPILSLFMWVTRLKNNGNYWSMSLDSGSESSAYK